MLECPQPGTRVGLQTSMGDANIELDQLDSDDRDREVGRRSSGRGLSGLSPNDMRCVGSWLPKSMS